MRKRYFLIEYVVIIVFIFILMSFLPGVSFGLQPFEPTNPTPANATTGVSRDMSLAWEGGDSDSGDDVTYSIYFGNQINPPFLGNITQPGTTTELSYGPLSTLDYSTNYYWYVNATDSYGNWTVGDEWNFMTIANSPPDAPSLVAPTNQATGIAIIDTILDWLGVTDPEGDLVVYDLYFGNQSSPSLFVGNLTPDSFTLNETLDIGTKYYWSVEARDEYGSSGMSAERYFTTTEAPDPFNLVNPIQGQMNVSITTALDWDDTSDPDGDLVTYNLYFGNQPNPSLFAGDLNVSEYSQAQLDSLDYNTTYSWYVNATDDKSAWTASAEWDFTTVANQPPNIPYPLDPTDSGLSDQSLINTILRWFGGDPEYDPVTYEIYFGAQRPAPSFINITQAGDIGQLSYGPLDRLNQSTTYYWRIDARDDHDGITVGDEWSFQTKTYMPSQPDPAHQATGISTPTILSWIISNFDPGVDLTYDVYFDDESPPQLLGGATNISEKYHPVSGLDYNTTYYWNIDVWDDLGYRVEGPEWEFMTEEMPNLAPVAYGLAFTAYVDTASSVTLTATDPNPGDTLTYFIESDPEHGVLSGAAPDLTYTPHEAFQGKDSFIFKVWDGEFYSNVATVSLYVWTPPERLDTATEDGTEPTLSYSPDGDLRVFYNKETPIPKMVVRTRLNAETVFDDEVFVYNGVYTTAIHYDTSGVIDLAVDQGTETYVLESLDGGASWDWLKTYSGHDGSGGEPISLAFTEDDTDLRLFYNYDRWSLFGTYPNINYAQRIDNVWDVEGVPFKGRASISGTYENGDTDVVFTGGGIYRSTDNGANFVFMDGDGSIPDKLQAYDVAVGPGGRLYFLRTYNYGGGRQLIFRYSDDEGATWSANQFIIENYSPPIASPHFAINGDKMIVVWLDWGSGGDYEFIKCVVSEDGGTTWSPIQTVVSLDAPKRIGSVRVIRYFLKGIDIESYEDTFTLAYSVVDGFNRDGVYLMELDFGTPELDPIGNKPIHEGSLLEFSVTATDVNGDSLTFTHPQPAELPEGATFTDHGDGTATFSWTPRYDQAGAYQVFFEVFDGGLSDSETITIQVSDVSLDQSLTVTEGDLIENLDLNPAGIAGVTYEIYSLIHSGRLGGSFPQPNTTDAYIDGNYFNWQTDIGDAATYRLYNFKIRGVYDLEGSPEFYFWVDIGLNQISMPSLTLYEDADGYFHEGGYFELSRQDPDPNKYTLQGTASDEESGIDYVEIFFHGFAYGNRNEFTITSLDPAPNKVIYDPVTGNWSYDMNNLGNLRRKRRMYRVSISAVNVHGYKTTLGTFKVEFDE